MAKRMHEGEPLGLKAGDNAVVVQSGYGSKYTPVVVDRVTPSGQLVVGGMHFYPDGKMVGGSFYHSRLVSPTPAVAREALHEHTVRAVHDAVSRSNWSRLSVEELQDIMQIMAPYVGKGERKRW